MVDKDQMLSNIVKYWNSALLCSPESSTSHADPEIAFLDNMIENRVLRDVLGSCAKENVRRCLDVGAGYGRFVLTFQEFYPEIVLLEAADRIYNHLLSQWQNEECVSCKFGTFESFEDGQSYDLIFASGILYLYDDNMTSRFLDKSRAMLMPKGLLILRDFIAEPSRVTKSQYVKDGFCYYRSADFWDDAAHSSGFEILQINRSKPRLTLLRHPRIVRVFRRLHVMESLGHPRFADLAMKFGNWRLTGSAIHTTYLVMRAL